MTHIIFVRFISLKRQLPLWLDEGIACSQETTALVSRLGLARNLIQQDSYLKFNKLFDIHGDSLIVRIYFMLSRLP